MTGLNAYSNHNVPAGWKRRLTLNDIPPVPAVIRPAELAGSAVVGTTSYPLPSTGAVFVDPVNGSDTNGGSVVAPFRTFQKATTSVAANGTIVLRAGTYHEGLVGTSSVYAGIAVQQPGVTVQNYPNEAVWFDGSSVVTGWVTDSTSVSGRTVFRKDGFTTQFDRSPTFSFGVADSTLPGWAFVNPSFPCAAWPDQVFIDGVQQIQVAALADVNTGTFYVDYAADKLYIGTSPTGKEVRASDLQTCMSALAVGVTLRGFGIRRYAPSMPHIGALKVLRSSCVLENIHVEDIATIGISCQGGSPVDPDGSFQGSHIVVRNTTALRCGNMGFHANNSDDLTLYRIKAEFNNREHFNYSPAAGGVKVSRLRGFKLTESVLSNNYAKGLWCDEAVVDMQIATCDFISNEETGLILELCHAGTVANCLITNTGAVGLNIFNTNKVKCWNNTLVGNGRLRGIQPTITFSSYRNEDINSDNRAPMTSTSTGRDTRYPFPDPSGMTWLITEVSTYNTINAKSPGQALFGLEDFTPPPKRSWQAHGLVMNGNFYNRVNTSSPAWEFILANSGSSNPTVYTNLPTFQATGLDVNSTGIDTTDALNADHTLKTAYESVHNNASPLPADVAALIGQPVGAKHVGCWR